jgi:hypothetical protein
LAARFSRTRSSMLAMTTRVLSRSITTPRA